MPTGRLWVVEDPEPTGPARADETPSPGRYIRDQRLRRGLTQSEVAELTKIPRASIEALEDERFEALPGPVFVKGFLRCCARALEIDEQVVLDLLYEQERARLRADREVASPPASAGAGARVRTAKADRIRELEGAASPSPTAEAEPATASTPPRTGAQAAGAPAIGAPPNAAAAPAAPSGGLRPMPRSFTSGVRPRIGGGSLTPGASGSAPIVGGEPPAGRGGEASGRKISTPAILGRARDLLERAGAVASRVPGANVLLWIAVALLVLGVAFAVLMAIGAQRMLPPHS
ncbi:MAG: helix-turn-helix domain-containing protein [Nannocystaceae bacterium]